MNNAAPFPAHGVVPVEPWACSIGGYKSDQSRLILETLQRRQYQAALEIGCAAGELTYILAEACTKVLAVDIAPSLVARARQRCKRLSNVSILCADVTEHLPDGPFDLVILREVCHQLRPGEVLSISLDIAERLAPGGELIAVHGTAARACHHLAGDSIHNLLSASLPLEWLQGDRSHQYRMDRWLKTAR